MPLLRSSVLIGEFTTNISPLRGWESIQVGFELIPHSKTGMGSTGDPPVPSGHWPEGTPATLRLEINDRKYSRTVRVPSGESPLGTGGSPVLPIGVNLENFFI